jgi:DNA-binding transcriptional ArsR family regulator
VEQRKEIVLEGWDRVKLYSHPLRRQILEHAVTPTTAVAIAESLRVPVTRLYRHLNALREAGLLAVVEERPKRGVIERWYQLVPGEVPTGLTDGAPNRLAGAQVHLNLELTSGVVALLRSLAKLAESADAEGGQPCVVTITIDAESGLDGTDA